MTDLAETTIQIMGTVEEIVFHNAENTFTVIEICYDGEMITVVGNMPEICVGEELTISGVWDTHNQFGRQFKAHFLERKLPDTTAQLLKYLSSGAIKGIGPKTALKIVERFGERSFDVLENEPERLVVLRGISKEKAYAISDEYKRQMAVRSVMIDLEAYGIKPIESIEIYRRFGAGAVMTIENNPYILCSEIDSIDFERADNIALALPNAPEKKHRLRAGIEHILRHNLWNGHTCVPKEKLIPLSAEYLKENTETIELAIDIMVEDKLLAISEVMDNFFVFLPDIYLAEKKAAERLIALLKFSPKKLKTLEDDITEIEKKYNISYESLQREAIITAAAQGVLILTGGPGTGKTTTLKGIISLFKQHEHHILLAAPTGRAAKRMSDVTGMESKTIHRLLEVEWDNRDKPIFRRNLQNPLDADVVIIDELSMVDISLFSSLLDAIPFGCRLVLVGDADQLPPVGAGNVLHDLINSSLIPVVRLNEVFRQAKQSLIVTNAHRIIGGEMPKIDANDSDFFFMERKVSTHASRTVAELCSKRLPEAYGLSPFFDIQVICPSRKGDCGTINLNRILQEKLNPPDDNKAEYSANNRLFREGDKVMQIKNNYTLEWHKAEESGTGVFNGDLGILREINHKNLVMKIDFDDRETIYPLEKLSQLELAYAITVHKSQGSEYDAVIMPIVDSPPQLMYRNLLYTAVTRAKRFMILIGRKSRLESMVENNRQNKRYSALCSFLSND